MSTAGLDLAVSRRKTALNRPDLEPKIATAAAEIHVEKRTRLTRLREKEGRKKREKEKEGRNKRKKEKRERERRKK